LAEKEEKLKLSENLRITQKIFTDFMRDFNAIYNGIKSFDVVSIYQNLDYIDRDSELYVINSSGLCMPSDKFVTRNVQKFE